MVNLFSHYSQQENRFTNGLLSILELSRAGNEPFIYNFFEEMLGLVITKDLLELKVLQDISKPGDESVPDAEISNKTVCLLIEIKIRSGSLRREQIRSHLKILKRKKLAFKKLVLLTPDSGESQYIKQFLKISPKNLIHLEWRQVYNYLEKYKLANKSLLSTIIGQYLDQIRSRIFNPDVAGIIMKVDFSDKSGVDPDLYLEQMRKGEWKQWRTPRQYKNLDGMGRKLILYDKNIKALTMEVEIEQVKKTNQERDYPWSNVFSPGTIRIYKYPVPVDVIKKLDGFEYFGSERGAYRNLSRSDYQIILNFSLNGHSRIKSIK